MDNLEPGTAAPRSGTYVCCWCGPAGLAEVMMASKFLLRTDAPELTDADITTPVSRRSTVYTMAAGEPLPQCPTCADATGWELLTGELEDLLRRRVEGREAVYARYGITRSQPLDPRETALDRLTITTDETRGGAPCDICGRPVAPAAGYLLPTRRVLTSEAYWCHLIRISAPQFGVLPPEHSTQEQYFSQLIRAREHDQTPWLVCDGCTELFLADWPVARQHALNATDPADPSDPEADEFGVADYVLPAARAWTRERGWWPATVVAPVAVTDTACDLCGKPIWAKESIALLGPDLVERWVRAGVLTADPAAPPRQVQGFPKWSTCMPCVAGALARLHRVDLKSPA